MTESTKPKARVAVVARAAVAVLLFLLIVVPQAASQSRGRRSGPGTGDPYEVLVPWRFLEKGGPLVKSTLVLYWLPATVAETERSPLLTSNELQRDTDRCLGFEIVLPTDAITIAALGETGKLPAALLVDAQGKVLRRVEGTRGRLSVASVEKMVRDELSERDSTMYQRITEARRRAGSGDKEGAIALYKQLWGERCLFPLAGEQAQHALKDLGVTVVEPPPVMLVDPNLPVAPAKPKALPTPEKHPPS